MAIDLTDRYHSATYQRAGTDWSVDRAIEPVRALVFHHTAGWYGPPLGPGASEAQELAQLDGLAQDHAARFGIGPGYYYAAFPSGRLYAIGKYGTHRAHTKGRNPQTGNWWNRESLAFVAFGNYETTRMSDQLKAALTAGIAEVQEFAGPLPIYPHGEVPGNPSVSACPGKYIKEWMTSPPSDRKPPPLSRVEHTMAAWTRRAETVPVGYRGTDAVYTMYVKAK